MAGAVLDNRHWTGIEIESTELKFIALNTRYCVKVMYI